MENIGPPARPSASESPESLEVSRPEATAVSSVPAEKSSKGVFSERFPLKFPKSRWLALDPEEREQLAKAQTLLEALRLMSVRTLRALVADTGMSRESMGVALGILDELGLISCSEDSDGEDVRVKLVATPEDHLPVAFPDGESRWIFIARPLVEPTIPQSQIN